MCLTINTFFLAVSNLSAATLYVSPGSTNPTPPYATWATAATNIQDAVDAAAAGDEVVVNDGVYPGGLTVDKALAVSSVNGQQFTRIQTTGVMNGVGGASAASLSGFTLAAGGFDPIGTGAYGVTLYDCTLTGFVNGLEAPGGAERCTLYNCTLSGNTAHIAGGAASCTLYNCLLSGNSAFIMNSGGGAYDCTLYNCTLTGNWAPQGAGGAMGCILYNCIVYFNTDVRGEEDVVSCTLNYCCTPVPPTNGVGNITNAPLFVDASSGDLRLQSNSPCINAGNNAYASVATDFDGNPRIVGGTVDIGAYECQSPALLDYFTWLQSYGLSTYAGAFYAHSDGNGMNNWQDWVAGLNPTNALSVLKMLSGAPTNNPPGLVVTWQSVNTRTYYLQSSTNLAAQPAFSTIQSNIVGQAGTTSYTDITATNAGPYFYRVGVGN